MLAGCAAFYTEAAAKTPQQTADDMRLGWNLGNTLDSCGGGSNPEKAETYWVHIKTDKQMIDDIKAQGFNTIRVPVTWNEKLTDGVINADWLARVKEVVDYGIDNGMYVILNVHHEDGNIVPTYAKADSSKQYLCGLWSQIAPYFKDYDEHLIFETMNEPRIVGDESEWTNGTEETCSVINRLNRAALDTIRHSGGRNATRLVMCPGNAAAIPAMAGFELPDDENVALSVHYYRPYNFAMNAGEGSTGKWGSDEDKAVLDKELKRLYDRFVSKGTPVIIGEMGATDKLNTADREAWARFFAQTAKSYGITCVVWDNNVITTDVSDAKEHYGLYNRASHTWYYPGIAKALSEGVDAAVRYTGGSSDPYISILYSGGSITLSNWGNYAVTEDMPYLDEGYYITVKYSGEVPQLVLQKYDPNREWNTLDPDKTENGIAYFGCKSIKNACKTAYENQNKIYVSARSGSTAITEVCVNAPHKAGDVSNNGRVGALDARLILLDTSNIKKLAVFAGFAEIDGNNTVDLLDVIKALQ